ncbi:MAG: recombinase family protein [Muribaculaceae bacterium]|nr:recombinase family protein [Muribaculaceae bacterium]
MRSAVIYARVSSSGDRQSTDRQVFDLREFANRNEYQIIKIFDEHISGAKKNEERPVLQECLDFCETDKIDIILVSELSRLGRNVDEVLATVKRCKDHKINIHFQKEGLSLFQPNGSKNPFLNIFISILGTVAEMERENIYFRLKSGRDKFVADGGKLGRKEGSTKSKEQKAEEYKNVLRELRRGTSVRRTAKLCDISHSTVERLKKEFEL